MKIAIYTIALNEAIEVDGWLQATATADLRLVVDTGSTDGTDRLLAEQGATVIKARVVPWRFDDALNIALHSLPADVDVCFRIDMDTRPRPGWRPIVESLWDEQTTAIEYPYHWSRETCFYHHHLHGRDGFRYQGATHEGLTYRGQRPYHAKRTDAIVVDHFPRNDKGRPNDLPLLAEAVREMPTDARIRLYYGRELWRQQHLAEATATLQYFLTLPNLASHDIAYAYRMLSQTDPENGLDYLHKAEEAASSPSNMLASADWYIMKERWQEAYSACQLAIRMIRQNPAQLVPGQWSDDTRLRNHNLHSLAVVAAWHMMDWEAAFAHAVEALRRAPNDETVLKNYQMVKEKIEAGATLEGITVSRQPRRYVRSVTEDKLRARG